MFAEKERLIVSPVIARPVLGRHEVRLGGVTDPVLTVLGHSTECVTTLRPSEP